jgi:hypothetical protein
MLKDILSKAVEMGVCFHRGPTFGEHGGTLPSQGLQEKEKISLFREIFYEVFERYVKKAMLMGSSLHRGCVGEPGGRFVYWDF